MTSRLFHYAFATLLISACTPVEQDKYSSYHHGGQTPQVQKVQEIEKSILPLSDPRGVNMQMMDQKLQDMVSEANAIESQVTALSARLKQLRDDIAGLALVKKVSVVADPYAGSDEIASENPQTIIPAINEQPSVSEPEAATTPTSNTNHVKAQEKIEDLTLKTSTEAGVVNVRHGIHSNKTRVVLDINGSVKNTMNFDAEAGIVTLNLPGTPWATANSRMYSLQQLSGYEAKESGQGTIIAMAVKNTSTVKVESIPATGKNSARLIVDLYK